MRSIRAAWCACAATVTAAGAGEAKEAPLDKSLPPLSPLSAWSIWQPSLSARVGGGFKDNVALSQTSPEASGFVRTSLDAVAVRLPVEGTQTTLLLLGEDTRYFNADTVDHEDFLFGQAELRRFWLNDWQAALSGEGAYIDQVVDLSVTETNRTRLAVKGGTVVGRPSARRDLSPDWWLAGESPVTRQMFDGVPDDYWVAAPKLTLGRSWGARAEVTMAYEFAYRHYDTDPAREASGDAITNETRVSLQNEVQAAWKQFLDGPRRFRTVLKLSYRWSADRVGDYFDYRRVLVSGQVRYRSGAWELSVEAWAGWYHFPNQIGTDPRDDRDRTDLGVTVRAERELGRLWRVFAEYEHGQTVSTLALEEYAANTVWGGVGLEF